MDNRTYAQLLGETADLLEIDGGDAFRIRSYRRAAESVESCTTQLSEIAKDPKKLQEILKAQNIPVELFLYEGADHGFLAYTRPFYRPDDAKLAWKRTPEFLGKHLKEK